MKKSCALVIAISLISGLIAQADLVGYYTFSGKSLASSDSDINSVAGDMVVGAGVTTFKWETRSFWSPTQPSAAFNAGVDFADATVLDDDYFSFTITPESGKEIDFTSISFIDRSGGFSVSVASDQDDFSNVIATAAAPGFWATTTLDLSSLSSTTIATEIRLYFHNGNGDNRMIDNVEINAAIPEPATLGLIASAGALMLVLHRRINK